MKIVNTKQSSSASEHYSLVKNYFSKNAQNQNGYFARSQKNKKQQKMYTICLSLIHDILKDPTAQVSALDVGCGFGDFTRRIAEQNPQIRTIIGVDFLLEVVDTATKNTIDTSRITYVLGDIRHLPLSPTSFYLTICIDTLHHIHEQDFSIALQELAQVTESFLLIEIRNKKNLLHQWYLRFLVPFLYKDLPVTTTSLNNVNQIIEPLGFHLHAAQRLELSKWNCRRLLLLYQRNLTKDL